MPNASLDHEDSLVAESINDRSVAAISAASLLARQPALTGVVAASDELALGVQHAAERAGRQISVVGYDDSPIATIGAGVTTIRQPVPEIARRIVAIASNLAAGDDSGPTHDRVLPELIVRGSTAPPPPPS